MSTPSIRHQEESNSELSQKAQYSYQIHKSEIQPQQIHTFQEAFDQALLMYQLSESRFIEQLAIADTYVPSIIDRGNTKLRVLFLFERGRYQDICLLHQEGKLGDLDDESLFKLGYSQFSQKQFAEAIQTFKLVNQGSGYRNHVNYYSGMAHYFTEQYDMAIKALQAVDHIAPYEGYNPYYITQIYYGQQDYQGAIDYGINKLGKQATLNTTEIRYLVGQAYYSLGNYSEALTYLEQYEAKTSKLTEKDFYQLGITNDRLGRSTKAKQYLSELIFCNSLLCQHAQYSLANIYLENGEEQEALALYTTLSKSSDDRIMQEEAKVNAALLHYTSEDYQSSLKLAGTILPDSEHYQTCQDLIGNILAGSEDKLASIQYLTSQDKLSPTLQNTLKQLELEQLRIYESDGELNALSKGLANLSGHDLTAMEEDLVSYWKGLIAFKSGDFGQSVKSLNKAKSLDNARLASKDYMLGYGLIETGKTTAGINTLLTCLNNSNDVTETKHLNLVIADAYTEQEDYNSAQSYYEAAAKAKSPYALLQLSEIARVQKDYYTRIYLLESFTEQYPKHPQYQKALFDIGETHIQLKEITHAIDYLDQAILATNGNTDIANESYLRLGLCYYNLGKQDQAIKAYKQVAEHSTDSNQKVIALEALKDIYLNDVGDTAEFFEFAEQSAQVEYSTIEKDSLAYLTNQKHYIAKDYTSAIKGYNSYLRKFPNGFYTNETTIELADCHYELGEYTKAQSLYRKLHTVDSEKLKTRSLLRSALISLNHTEEYTNALSYFQQLIPLAKDENERKELIDGAFFSAVKTADESILTLSDMIINDNSRSSEDHAKAYYHKGKMLRSKQQDDAAIQAFTEVTRKSKSNIAAEANYLIAETFYLKGSLDAAERQANETTKRAKSYPYWIGKSLLLLTDIYIDNTDLLNARAACEVVLENFDDNPELSKQAKDKMQMIEVLEAKASRILPAGQDTLIFQDIDQN